MRIVYVLTSLGMGGAERQVLSLADRMAWRGHSVAVLVLRPKLPEEWPTALDVTYLNMRKTPLSLLLGVMQGRRFIGQFHPNLIHSHTYPGNMVARLLKLLCPSAILISTIHNVYEGGWKRMLAYRLTDWLSRLTTAVSTAAAERFVHLKAIPQSKCRVMVNGIDTAEFAPEAGRHAKTRDAMNAALDFIWLTAGRITEAKDYPNLLRAFALVQAKIPSTQLWIAGEGEEEEVSAMRGLGEGLGLGAAVCWLGLRRDMPALLDAADGFVLGSAWEGMPLAVGEAMAMAKPVAVTDVGGVRELVGESGVIIPAKNPALLAAAMLGLMNRPATALQALGNAARERICASFSMNAKADEWELLYQGLLKTKR
jgi:glycosyltransferase involved in cell wall biosynthesis